MPALPTTASLMGGWGTIWLPATTFYPSRSVWKAVSQCTEERLVRDHGTHCYASCAVNLTDQIRLESHSLGAFLRLKAGIHFLVNILVNILEVFWKFFRCGNNERQSEWSHNRLMTWMYTPFKLPILRPLKCLWICRIKSGSPWKVSEMLSILNVTDI